MKASQSRLEAWEGCKRKYYYTYEEEIMGKGASLSAHRGNAIHAGLAAHYGGQNHGQIFKIFHDYMEKFPGEKDEEWETEGTLWAGVLARYRDSHQEEPFEILGIEETVERQIRGQHSLEGILDLRVRMKRDGEIWVVDHKTASRTGAGWWPQWFVSKQLTQYQWLVPEARGVILNVLKPTKTECFEREGFTRTQEQIEDFLIQTQWECEEMESAHGEKRWVGDNREKLQEVKARLFPQATQHCHSWGRTCVFLPLCQGGEAARPLYIPREKR